MADLFKHIMTALYDEKMQSGRVNTFLLNFFGKNPQELVVSDTEKVNTDVIRDNRIVAVDVVRGGGAGNKNVVGKYTAHEYAAPLYWEESPITAAMLNKRLPGVDPYSDSGRMEALAYWASRAQVDNTNKILRAMEKMAAEALEDGTITLTNGDSLDFGKQSEHNIVPSTKWDNSGDPIGDLQTLADVVFQDGKLKPNTLIFGADAWDAFINNSDVQTYLDNRRIEPGRLAPGETIEGAKTWGAFDVGQYRFVVYIYDEFYDSSGTATPYITTDTVVMLNSQARLTKAYCAVEVLPQFQDDYREMGMPSLPEFQPGEIVPFVYNLPPSSVMAGVQSAPLVIPTAIDTIGTLKTVDT